MTIKDVAEKFDISQDTLRYYEKVGLIPKVNRTSGGVRDYTEQDIRHVEFVKCMRQAGLSIEVLAQYISLYQDGDETVLERRQILIDERDRLKMRMEEMKETLDRLDFKINNYDRVIRGETKIKREDI